jgi:hypothetical protein
LTVNTSFSAEPSVENSSAEPSVEKHKGHNNFWSNFWSYDPTYKFLYDTKSIVNMDNKCDEKDLNDKLLYAGKNSIFYVNQRSINDGYDIIEFEDIKIINDEKIKFVEKGVPYKMCKKENSIPEYYYKRTGGIITGLLVVPFKYRTGGQLSGDAAVGPYVGVSGEKFSVLASLCLSQIAINDVNSKEVENRTGVTAAAGINWMIASNFEIALIAGIDHLSGSAGDDFKYQDKLWGSFAIGYNFTR